MTSKIVKNFQKMLKNKKLQNAEKSPIFNIQKLISPLFFNKI